MYLLSQFVVGSFQHLRQTPSWLIVRPTLALLECLKSYLRRKEKRIEKREKRKREKERGEGDVNGEIDGRINDR